MKRNKKIILSLILLLLMIISFPFIKESRSRRIIQARLIDSGNLTYESIAELYEGILTFQNLNNGEKHTYFVCLRDLSNVKLNEIYDLPANYYIPHGGPNESMQTNGCNFSLNLSKTNY